MIRRINLMLAAGIVLLAATMAGADVVWQIGQVDESWRDLAFDGDLGAYIKDFPNDVTFNVGRDDPKTHFSAHHAGQRDKTAGRRPHPFVIHFNLDDPPAGGYLLTIDILDTEAFSAPTYRVRVNGYEAERLLECGSGALSILRPEKGRHQRLRFVISDDQLRQGRNTIELTIVRGMWLLYDAVTLERFSDGDAISVSADVKSSVFFIERDGQLKREFVLTADGIRDGPSAEAAVYADDALIDSFELDVSPFGTVQQKIHLPTVDRKRQLRWEMTSGDQKTIVMTDQVPQKKWRIYVAPAVHIDIGYNRLQSEIADIHNRNTAYAMELAEAFNGFVFNLECAWAARTWFRDQPRSRHDDLLEALRGGQLGLSALYLNMLTGLCSEEELIRNISYAAELHRAHGLPLTTAMVTDAPSHVWSLPSILAGAGIRYCSVGVNDVRAPLFKKNIHHKNPFWWEGPDGRRVLTWFAVGYGFRQASRLGIRPELEDVRVALEKEMSWWVGRDDYPYDAIYFHGIYGDNQAVHRSLAEKVADYNERYAYPKLILCRPEQFFEYIEERFADQVPTLRGCGGSWWEDGAGSSAYETAINRKSQEDILAAEKIWSVVSTGKTEAYPRAEFEKAWENILFYDEHTWGANDSITRSMSDWTIRQWAVKAGFALNAARQSKQLLSRGLYALAERVEGLEGSLLVFNPGGDERTGPVVAEIPRDASIFDGDRVVPSQVVRDDERGERQVIFVADNVPAMGYHTYAVRPGSPQPALPERFDGTVLENNFYRIEFDSASGGIRSLRDKRQGAELVDQASPYKLGQMIYASGGLDPKLDKWTVPNPDLIERTSPRDVEFNLDSAGSVFTSVISMAELDGFGKVIFETRAYEKMARVDFLYHLDKQMTFDKEAVYFAFPFAGKHPRFRYEVGGGSVRPNEDQLPGACRDWFAVQRWVTVNTDDVGVAWVPMDTPLVSFCDMQAGRWLTDLPITNGTVFAYAMNNYWCTNYKAGQDGELTFRYCLTSERTMPPDVAAVFGESVMSPLQAVRLPKGSGNTDLPSRMSFCRIEPASVLLTAVKPADDGNGLIVRFRETAGRRTEARVHVGFDGVKRAWRCDLIERDIEPVELRDGTVSLMLDANEMAVVRFCR